MSSLKTTSNLRLAWPWLLLIGLGITASQLWQDHLVLEKTLASSQQELAQIRALSLEYQTLGGAIKVDQTSFTTLNQAIKWLTNGSQQQGLDTNISVIEAEPQGQKPATRQLEVSFKQAHFNRLIQWIEQQNMTNLNIVSGQFSAADSGKVSGFLRLEIR